MSGNKTQIAILAMREAGLSYRAISRVLGVNDSLVGQIARGAKPGANLSERAGLAAESVARTGVLPPAFVLPEAPRRAQRVRQPIRRAGRSWETGTLKRQAVRSGARGLAGMVSDSAARNRRVSIRMVTSSGREVRIGNGGKGIDATQFAALVDQHGGDVAAAAAAYAGEKQYDDVSVFEDVEELEISSWDWG